MLGTTTTTHYESGRKVTYSALSQSAASYPAVGFSRSKQTQKKNFQLDELLVQPAWHLIQTQSC